MKNYAITTELHKTDPNFKIIESGFTDLEIVSCRADLIDPTGDLWVIDLDEIYE